MCALLPYLVIGLTLASTTDRPLQHFMLSGNSWIPVSKTHSEERGNVAACVSSF